jgi:hypothetical protein
MVIQRMIIYMAVGAILALGIAFGGFAAFAQTEDGADTETPAEESDTPVVPEEGTRPFGFGRHEGFGAQAGIDQGQALADALGITLEELQAAQETAHAAQIAQMVTDGLLTQEQADQILSGEARFHGGRGHFGGSGEALAEALGITVEALQAAQNEVQAARLAAMVEAGVITQEQADMMAARQAVQDYVDREGLQAAIQSAYEEAVAQALADGVITQEQADALLSNIDNIGGFGGRGFGFDGGPGFGGHGPHGGRGPHGGPGFQGNGFAPFQNDSQPDTTDTSLDA